LEDTVHSVPGSGFISVPRIVFVPVSNTAEFTYDSQILYFTILHGDLSTLFEFLEVFSLLSKSEDCKFCPGLDEKTYFDN